MKQLWQSRKRKLTIICASVLLCLLGVAYIGRGVVREAIIPFAVQMVVMPKVNHQFRTNFTPVNAMLADYGFHMQQTADDTNGCDAPFYEYLSESVYCNKSNTSNKLRPSAGLRKAWRTGSPALEKQLLAAGWKKDNVEQPIATVLDNTDPNDFSQYRVTYRIQRSGAECVLDISNSPSSNEIYAGEGCEEYVNLFGGY
jgi:hypothetical protein